VVAIAPGLSMLASASTPPMAATPASAPPVVDREGNTTAREGETALPPAVDGSLASEDLTSLSLDDLIDRLPPAGEEWWFDFERGDGVESPVTQEMSRRLETAILTDDQWRRALLGTGAIRLRTRWPREVPYAISLTVPRWLAPAQIKVAPTMSGWRTVAAGELVYGSSGTRPAMRARDARVGQELGPLPEAATNIEFEIEIRRSWTWLDARPMPGGARVREELFPLIWRGTIVSRLEPIDSWHALLPGAHNEALDEAVRRSLGAGMRVWGNQGLVPYLVIDPDTSARPVLATTGLDLRAELLDGETVMSVAALLASDLDCFALSNSVSRARKRFYGSCKFEVPEIPTDTSRWRVRITGRLRHPMRLWSATTHWSGSMVISWNELVAQEQRRCGAMGRGPERSTPHAR